jgi:hypothetical protein
MRLRMRRGRPPKGVFRLPVGDHLFVKCGRCGSTLFELTEAGGCRP